MLTVRLSIPPVDKNPTKGASLHGAGTCGLFAPDDKDVQIPPAVLDKIN